MSSKSKAYQAAAEHMAASGRTLTPEDLEAYHGGTWDIIWKAARRAEWKHSQRDQDVLQASITKLRWEVERLQGERNRQAELHQTNMAQSKNRMDRIGTLSNTNALLAENVRLKKALDEAKLGVRLYDQVERENNYHENALKLAEQEIRDLREKLRGLDPKPSQQLVDSLRSSLATCGAKRNELLVRTVAAEAKLDALEKVPARPQGKGWVLAWTRMTGETITGMVSLTPGGWGGSEPLVRCLAVTGKHACENKTQVGREHPQRHLCHCGTSWSH